MSDSTPGASIPDTEPSAPPAVSDAVGGAESSSALSPDDAAGALASARKDAARYRSRLRETAAERDTLRSQIDKRDRLEAERTAGVVMAAGADLWTAGVELAELRGDDGTLSGEAVQDAARRVIAERPHWARQAQSIDGGARQAVMPASTFGEQLKQRVGSG